MRRGGGNEKGAGLWSCGVQLWGEGVQLWGDGGKGAQSVGLRGSQPLHSAP